MRLRWFAIAAGTGLVLAAIAGAGWLYLETYAPDRGRFPIRGIDVSHHQGDIDWPAVAADDVAFAILKATEGGDHVDREFAGNVAEAREAGIAVGAYHFFTFCKSGAEQAANFLAAVPRDGPMLPPVLDIEYSGNCATRPPPEQLARELSDFMTPVEAAFGQEVMIYLIGDAWRDYAQVVPQRRRWVRWIAWEPMEAGWTVWQYHDRGDVDGIEGDVDLNVLSGGPDALQTLLRQPPA